MHRRGLAAVRVTATAVIASIAAWVSYWHMAVVASRYGETNSSPYLLPISVDGLIVVASICLVELAGRIRHVETPPSLPHGAPAGWSTPEGANGPATTPPRAGHARRGPLPLTRELTR